MPKVSVLMPNYNGENHIKESIESILGQTYTDFEFIIVDDASTDTSWNIIEQYRKQDSRIRTYKNEANLGIASTRNILIDLASGDYLAWLDSDDCAYPDRLKKQVQFLDTHSECGIVGSWMTIIDFAGRKERVKQLPVSNKAIRKQWYFRNPVNQPTLMMTRECVKKVGYYDPQFEVASDLDFCVRASQYCEFANIPEVLVEYRMHGNNISFKKQRQTINNTLLIRQKMGKLGYKMGILGHIAYGLTWCTQFIPPKLTVFFFYSFIELFRAKKAHVK